MAYTSWSVPIGAALKWREWDGDFVVFNPLSGDTHFFNGIAGSVLKFLESTPASLEEIVAYLEEVSGKPIDPELGDHLRELIDELDAVGLIEPVRR